MHLIRNMKPSQIAAALVYLARKDQILSTNLYNKIWPKELEMTTTYTEI